MMYRLTMMKSEKKKKKTYKNIQNRINSDESKW